MTTDQILEALHQLSSDDLKKIADTAQALYQLERKRFKEQRSQLLAEQALLVLEDYQSDSELTVFTDLDDEDFYDYTDENLQRLNHE